MPTRRIFAMSPLGLGSVGEWILLAGILCAVFGAVFANPWQVTSLIKIDMDKLGLAMLFVGALIEIRQAKKRPIRRNITWKTCRRA
jgi:hypothetical protein